MDCGESIINISVNIAGMCCVQYSICKKNYYYATLAVITMANNGLNYQSENRVINVTLKDHLDF